MKKQLKLKHSIIYPLVLLFIFFLAIYIGLTPFNPPKIKDNSESEVSIESVWGYLENIAQEPHPVGSIEHARVREYLVDTLEEMGYPVELQDTLAYKPEIARATQVQNILTRLEGTDATGTIMLAAHYDTVFNSPGASDDGYGVAALLEVARLLQDKSPKNDIIFLITDAEEQWLFGARAFVEEHPWAKEVDVVFNFEARGNTGSTVMFETSKGNYQLIKEFHKATSSPASNSFLKEVYDVMPNGTDLTEFMNFGMQGLNFASAQGLNAYHTTIDSLDFVNKDTLLHHATYAYELATHFGNIDLNKIENQSDKNAVYFNLFGHTLISYSESMVIPLLIISLLGLILTIYHGIRKKQLKITSILIGFLLLLVSLALTFSISLFIYKLIDQATQEVSWLLINDQQIASIFLIGFLLITTAILILFISIVQRKIGTYSIVIGTMICWFLLAVATSFLLTGASYLFVWPLIFSLIGINLVFWKTDKWSNEKYAILYSVFLIPGIVLFTFLVNALYLALTITVVHIVMAVATLSLMLFVPVFTRLIGSWKYAFGLLVIGISILTYESITLEATSEHPTSNEVYYLADGDSQKAIWGTKSKPDAYTGQFVDGEAEKGNSNTLPIYTFLQDLYVTEAPYYEINLPESNITTDDTVNGWRTLTFDLSTPNAAAIEFVTKNHVTVKEMKVNDTLIQSNPTQYTMQNPLFLELIGMGESMTLEVTVKEGQKLEFYVISKSFELPGDYEERPSNMTTYGDQYWISRTFQY
ncbi:M20/M25/M40 family metallo-hydrolase [Ornithinibacillus halotolerans]|uniref:Peptidase M28 domain-containing protein n=1 Tax=Ornithinibacillus halotolerans TaxID=1274357 RepID=A0A916RWJ6_9BACI|nr:M20/M25/M40 family metallo-hydrolase [Ornithinibacillus halotolerans]GGA74436.1 hypothetical protein GCM10008025_17730 [Ornithinibacillus halotolerans]